MSILKIKSKDFEMELSMDGNGNCSVSSSEAVQASTPEKNDMGLIAALIALSVNDYADDSLHDRESNVITIVNRPSEWSSKSFGLNRGINLRK